MDYHVQPGGGIRGNITVPGDKSISHRSVILGSIADGVTQVSGLLEGVDVLATIHAFREMGVFMKGPEEGELIIHGNGLNGLKKPASQLDLGNSGTCMRLLTGLLAAQNFETTLFGDESLNSRPMRRVVEPLTKMGAKIRVTESGTPPVHISAVGKLKGGEFELQIASAQLKSALMLAGLYADSPVVIHEKGKTRDHTERMLTNLGCQIEVQANQVKLTPPQSLNASIIKVPGDISSAAFFIVGAIISPNCQLLIKNVGINPTRTGVIDVLKAMGANIELTNTREVVGEPVADIMVTSSDLSGIEVSEDMVASAIDEFPIIGIAAACAKGQTTITGASELRVKESDRITAMVTGLTGLGIDARELADGMIVNGGSLVAGTVDSFHDHRIAMSFAMAGLCCGETITIKNCKNVATSFPGFVDLAKQSGLNINVVV